MGFKINFTDEDKATDQAEEKKGETVEILEIDPFGKPIWKLTDENGETWLGFFSNI